MTDIKEMVAFTFPRKGQVLDGIKFHYPESFSLLDGVLSAARDYAPLTGPEKALTEYVLKMISMVEWE